jgi:hypothetical protein
MARAPKKALNEFDDEAPEYESLDNHDPDGALVDSEVDFDDEADDDQLPIDYVEAREVGANLDDPGQFADE